MARAQDVSAPESVQICVGDDGLSLIREIRHVQLNAGLNRLRVYDFCPGIDPASVHLRATGEPGLVELRAQSYWIEILDRQAVLDKIVGQKIKFERDLEDGRQQILEGRLLFPPSALTREGREPIPLFFQTLDGEFHELDDGRLILEQMPATDWNRPRLDWLLHSGKQDRTRLELYYLSRGLSWEARYTVWRSQGRADLCGYATVSNETGARFSSVQLQLTQTASATSGEESRFVFKDTTTLEPDREVQLLLVQARGIPCSILHCIGGRAGPAASPDFAPLQKWTELSLPADLPWLPAGSVEVYSIDDEGRCARQPALRCEATRTGSPMRFFAGTDPLVVVCRNEQRDPMRRKISWELVNSHPEPVTVMAEEMLGPGEAPESEATEVETRGSKVSIRRAAPPGKSRIELSIRLHGSQE